MPVPVDFYFKGGDWIMENQDLEISVQGKDYDECVDKFDEELLFLWQEFGLASDSELTDGGKIMRHKITKVMMDPFVGSVLISEKDRDNYNNNIAFNEKLP